MAQALSESVLPSVFLGRISASPAQDGLWVHPASRPVGRTWRRSAAWAQVSMMLRAPEPHSSAGPAAVEHKEVVPEGAVRVQMSTVYYEDGKGLLAYSEELQAPSPCHMFLDTSLLFHSRTSLWAFYPLFR